MSTKKQWNADCPICYGRGEMRIYHGTTLEMVPCQCIRRKARLEEVRNQPKPFLLLSRNKKQIDNGVEASQLRLENIVSEEEGQEQNEIDTPTSEGKEAAYATPVITAPTEQAVSI